MDTVLRIILLLCAYIEHTVAVTMELAATETGGQYSVTVPIPAECCGDQCWITEPNTTTGQIVAHIFPTAISLTPDTKLKATFTGFNGTTLFIKLGPVDKSVFSRQYVGHYGLTFLVDCPIHNYYIRDITSTTTTVNKCTHVVDDEGTIWNDTSVMVTQIVACPKSYLGNITRMCDKCGVWQTPVYNCTRKLFSDILNRFNNKTSKVTEAEVDMHLDTLAQETSDDNVTMYANDLFSQARIQAYAKTQMRTLPQQK